MATNGTTIPSLDPANNGHHITTDDNGQRSPSEDIESTPTFSSISTQTDQSSRTSTENTALTSEESNFLRLCHLVEKIAPQAMRHRFNQVFPPAELQGIIQRNQNILTDLKTRKIITKLQWNLIFPYGSTPISTTFDVTLMILFFRHLSNISPISGDYDTLPPPSDITLGANLARIKYYRNKIAHFLEHDRKLDNHDLAIVWETVSKAVSDIGEKKYEQECLSLLTSPLDSSYMDVYREVLMREAELNKRIRKVNQNQERQLRYIQTLQMELNDPLPKHQRDYIKDCIKRWRLSNRKFAETYASKTLLRLIVDKNVAIVTGRSGTGKSFSAQHVLLRMASIGYDVIPVTSASEMVKLFCDSTRQIFFIDNLCGKCNISKSDVEDWEKNYERLKIMFKSPVTKFIFVCSLQIFQDSMFKCLKIEMFNVINLSGAHKLNLLEKMLVGVKYIQSTILRSLNDRYIRDSLNFPLLCSLYEKNPNQSVDFFEKPYWCFQHELDDMKQKSDKTKYACIALCVLYNNNVPFDLFHVVPSDKTKVLLSDVFEELAISVAVPRKALQSQFDCLVGTFLKQDHSGYQSIHDYLFDIFCSHVSTTMIQCVIKHCDSALICERALLKSLEEHFEPSIIIPIQMEDIFLQRLMTDFQNGKLSSVFESHQIEFRSFQLKLMSCFKKKKQNLNIVDEEGRSAVYICSKKGYSDFLENICNEGGNVNLCTKIGQSPLEIALDKNQKTCLDILLKHGADVNRCNAKGETPLLQVCLHGYVDFIQILCEKGANINQCDQNGKSLLYLTLEKRHKESADVLLKIGVDVNKCDAQGNIPLSVAAFHGFTDIVQLLCDKVVDINQVNISGTSAFLQALLNGQKECADILLQKGANVNMCNSEGCTPLLAASLHGFSDIVQALCDKGANINQCDKFGCSALLKATHYRHKSCVKILLRRGAEVNKCDEDGDNPILLASTYEFTDILQMLVVKGGDVNNCNTVGESPLLIALRNQHKSCAAYLIKKGADVNTCDKDGTSPLLIAVTLGLNGIVKKLIFNGANINQCNKFQLFPLFAASRKGFLNIVKILCNKKAKIGQCNAYQMSSLFTAVVQGNAKCVKTLLRQKGEVNKCDKLGNSPLLIAALRGLSDIVKLLLDKGADVTKTNKFGRSPLHAALDDGQKECAVILLENGADVNQCDGSGVTPLLVACSKGFADIVQLLCDKGADVNHCAENGYFPLLAASDSGFAEIVKILCDSGADINKCDNLGRSSFFSAVQYEHEDCAELLCNRGADIYKCDNLGTHPIQALLQSGHIALFLT